MTTSTPTIVLVHGAFADSSSWDGVIRRLLADRYDVTAVANPLRGRDADAGAITNALDAIPGPKVLVGHSIGGFATTNAAAGRDDVRALVYVAAFAPEAGETAAGLSGKFPGATLGEALAPPAGPDLLIAQDRYHHQFAADVPAEDARVMAVTQRPIAAADLDAPSGEPAWKTIASWFIFGDEDRNIPVAAHRWMAERAGARRTMEIAGASHVVGMSHPAALVELVREAVAATAPVPVR